MKANDKDFLPFYRWEHRATVGLNVREFIVFLDNLPLLERQPPKMYIEEVVGSSLVQVEEEELWEDLGRYAEETGVLEMQLPIMKPQNERFV
ncbi:MAG: hypothetical protein DRI97_15555 [Bacteroidetes bacterium]|nr:MAG: hypothetical protein DRI97_15555 [Bacteroidota bacterium]